MRNLFAMIFGPFIAKIKAKLKSEADDKEYMPPLTLRFDNGTEIEIKDTHEKWAHIAVDGRLSPHPIKHVFATTFDGKVFLLTPEQRDQLEHDEDFLPYYTNF